ncbi:C6 transcription factor, putative [Metarhizium acridum CQMa 102]|uniref:C6 transcription factor, putative n=1 Tax=Metarhizium acridum (strain CQMa 102) TaxID=655827 RepID=E9E1E8_METAQ|nr:C6 transcription factor, putative [Metarhizium acridum CQMa 102]EFY90181.1 C6 transcription factor, putative [Metarhizium acridum CQMa 102]
MLALAAAFTSPTAAEKDLLTPKICAPASLLPTLDHPEPSLAIPTSAAGPSAGRISGRFGKRAGNGEYSSIEKAQPDKRSGATTTRSNQTSTADTAASPLPSPFDNPVPNAFQVPGSGDSCPKFIAALLSDPTFKSCYPISMLIQLFLAQQTSTSFFNAQKELVSIVKVLDATCDVDVAKCTAYMTKAAQNLTASTNCKRELDQNQTQVVQAWQGLRAYNVLYSATCLQNPSSTSYCFANAVTNLSNPSDAFLYFMPYATPLPGTSVPSCSWCVQNTMFIYHSASANRAQLVASVYLDAVNQVNTICGPNFVNSTLPAAENGAFTALMPSHISIAATTLFTLFLLVWFL